MEVEKEREAAFAEAAALEEALEDNGDYLPRFSEFKASPLQPKPKASQPQQKQPDRATGHTERTTKVSLRERLVKDEEDINPNPADQDTAIHHDLSFPGSSPRTTGADLAKFLARSQLITTGLTKFDDKVENYWAWKSSFSNAVKGLELTEAEELDLLVKWLGRESSEHVRRIKSVHIRHPAAGLKMAWDRLEQCYGTPEAIESALFARLESFPKISGRDVQKLRDLADLLLEIEAAKEDCFLPGLSYLDTARGIHPILEKLPYHLQDKWTSYGFKYKEQYQVSFPPFAIKPEMTRASSFVHLVTLLAGKSVLTMATVK
ncbi:hypothetical protein NFI96_021124 [Prochilodus magdalenae]|nr:hypothetical protein NFI96_021124 [Prochilodus magdalenae]